MCGIFFCVHKSNLKTESTSEEFHDCNCHLSPCSKLKDSLGRRGPDSMRSINKVLNEEWTSCILSTVLWTQGAQKSVQPLQDNDGNILLWNGDLLYGPLEDSSRCDSEVMFEQFKRGPLNTITTVCGPYAFVFWDSASQQLWFGRDVFGRHSLLWNVSLNTITLTSTAHRQSNLTEVPALGIYQVDLSGSQKLGKMSVYLVGKLVGDSFCGRLKRAGESAGSVPEINFYPWGHLITSRIHNFPEIPQVVVRSKIKHFVLGDGSSRESWLGKEPLPEELENLLDPASYARADKLLQYLSEAVQCRVSKQPGVCKLCDFNKKCTHCPVAVLFSGGLDSTILALLAHRFIPDVCPVDLYNVAFQLHDGSYNVPDRITGQRSLEELKTLVPNRVWNFIEINVSQNELTKLRNERIADLIHPLTSVLDDSIGCALWFAASGQGYLDGLPYSSSARIVLLGMGADEQLGGYTRHRNTLRHTGKWAALGSELIADTDNISLRNLGRDNRVVSDHGRQPRTPFLDEKVVDYINSLAPWHRCMLTSDQPPGVGDKLLLRLVAQQLGLTGVATLPKRALQFGSRIANHKEKGNQVSKRL